MGKLHIIVLNVSDTIECRCKKKNVLMINLFIYHFSLKRDAWIPQQFI